MAKNKKPTQSRELHKQILDTLNRQKNPVSPNRLSALLDRPQNDEAFRDALLLLRRDGLVYAVNGDRYASAKGLAAKPGTIDVHERGFGFVTLDEGGDDVHIPENRIADAIDGDRVLITSAPRKGKPNLKTGTVLGVIERPDRPIVGTLRSEGGISRIHPDDRGMEDLPLVGTIPDEAKNGHKIIGRMTPVTLTDSSPSVTFERVLGSPSDPETAMQSIIQRFEFSEDYPDEAIKQAKHISGDISAEELAARRDLRAWDIVTIDPADAADLDDALSLTRDDEGRAVVGIHIADVAHYVERNTPIDKEAVDRGTSVYLPGRVLHMLPKELSAGVCSLLPDGDRLAMSVLVTFNPAGNPVHVDFTRSVIRSRAKLAYEQVEDVLNRNASDDNPAKQFEDLLLGLGGMAKHLTAQRMESGALDFDMPEVKVTVGENGHVDTIGKHERLQSHRLVEEFMLLANRSVAHALNARGYELLYRVHDGPDPDKLSGVIHLAAALGHTVRSDGKQPGAKDLQRLLAEIKDEPIAPVIEMHLLRSMAKAVYQPKNIGHYGLATDEYAHFTSPIRRYPDLVVHRQVKRMIDREESAYSLSELERLGKSTSEAERDAEAAEREATKIKQAEYLAEHLGAEFDGTISGVTRSGMFIIISDLLAEGYISVTDLPQDDYYHDEARMSLTGKRRRLTFHFGDPVTVQVARVDTQQGRIDFELVDAPNADKKRTGAQASDPPKPHTRRRSRKMSIPKGKGKGKAKGKSSGKPSAKKKPRKKRK